MIAGRPGARYAVRLVNNSGQRVLAVVAIDGVNVVSGETASVGQRGYVLEPWQRTEITGWRKSDDEVAAFEFTALADSYAARTGRPRRRRRDRRGGVPRGAAAGGVASAGSRRAPPARGRASTAAPPPGAAPPPRAPPRRPPRRGAGPRMPPRARRRCARRRRRRARSRRAPSAWARATAPARPRWRASTTFQRATAQPEQRVEIRYDSLDNLVAAGIVPPPRVAAPRPHAFPADPPRDYVPDPPRR